MSTQYFYIKDILSKFWSRSFKTRFETKVRQSEYMASAFGPSGKPREILTELAENKKAYDEEYLALVEAIIMSIRDKMACEVLKGNYRCQEPYGVQKRLKKYVGWSSGTLATLRTLFTALDAHHNFLLTIEDFVKFLNLMGESSSDYERMIRISQLMESKDEINLDEFFDMVYKYSCPCEEGKLGELAYRVFLYSIKQECMNKGSVSESMSQCFL